MSQGAVAVDEVPWGLLGSKDDSLGTESDALAELCLPCASAPKLFRVSFKLMRATRARRGRWEQSERVYLELKRPLKKWHTLLL